MKKKKLISIVTALVLFGSLTACGNSQGTSQSGQENQTSQTGSGALTESSNQTQSDGQTANTKEKNLYGYDEPVTIKVGLSFAADFKWVGDDTSTDNVWMDLYRENNIMPEILYEVTSSEADAKLSTAILSGNYPDILQAKPSDYVNYANTDVIADITDVFEEYASDELKEYVNVDGGLAMQSCMVDGRLYGIPQMGNSYDAVTMMFIRKDWLDNLGLDIPESMEDLKSVAHAFTYDDPDKNGANDTYGLALPGMNILDNAGIFAGYGAYPGSDGLAFVEGSDGKVTWGGTNAEGMKAALTLLQEMYQDGSLVRDFITMDGNSIFEETGSGRCGIWFLPMWGAMVPAQNAMKADPNAHMVAAPVPDGLNQGGGKVLLASTVSNIFCVSSKCEHPEVLIKLLNLSVQKLCYPESTEEFYTYYGDPVQKEHTGNKASLTITLAPLKNLDNYYKESAALQSGDTSELNTEQLGDYESMKYYLDKMESDGFDAEDAYMATGIGLYTVFGDPIGGYAAVDKMIQNDLFVRSAYNALPTDSMAENAATLKKLTEETIVKIITGESVDSYDSFLETWYALGGQDVIDDAQAWADAN